MIVKDFYIMHLIDIFAKFSSISVFTTRDFCDYIYTIFMKCALKHQTDCDGKNMSTELEKELLSVFNEISDYANNLEFKETLPPKEGIRRVMDEIYETNDYNIKSKLIPYWYNIHYLVNIYKNTESNNYQNFVRNGFSYPTYQKNFPFNEYYAFMAMLNRPKI